MNSVIPRLSVVIPTLGRPILINTLHSLFSASDMDQVEVIVVGVIPDQPVLDRLREMCGSHHQLRHIQASFEKGDSSNKKNLGLKESRAEIVAFVDDDVVVAPNWPGMIMSAFDNEEVGMVSGPSLVPDDLPLMARLAGMVLASGAAGYVSERYRKGREVAREIKWSRIIGCNMAFRKSILNRIGAFDPEFWPGEEMVASFNIAETGSKIVFQPEAWVYHYPRASLRGFVRQIYGYGATRIRLVKKGLEFEPTTIVPALWVLSLFVLGATAGVCRICAFLLLIDLLVYLVADLVITLAVWFRTKQLKDLLLIFIIPVMHMTYGIAEWIEIFRPGRDLSDKSA